MLLYHTRELWTWQLRGLLITLQIINALMLLSVSTSSQASERTILNFHHESYKPSRKPFWYQIHHKHSTGRETYSLSQCWCRISNLLHSWFLSVFLAPHKSFWWRKGFPHSAKGSRCNRKTADRYALQVWLKEKKSIQALMDLLLGCTLWKQKTLEGEKQEATGTPLLNYEPQPKN